MDRANTRRSEWGNTAKNMLAEHSIVADTKLAYELKSLYDSKSRYAFALLMACSSFSVANRFSRFFSLNIHKPAKADEKREEYLWRLHKTIDWNKYLFGAVHAECI